MDAKAKVVCWIRPDLIAVLDKCRNDTHNGTVDVWMRPVDESYVGLVPEAALAEAMFDAQCKLDTDKEIIESQAKDLHRLLTDLEALADALDSEAIDDSLPAEYRRACDLYGDALRILTNSAKGGE